MSIAKLQTVAGTLAIGSTLVLGAWGLSQPPAQKQPGLPVPDNVPTLQPRETKDGKPVAPGRSADYAQRQRSLKNLKQLMLAIHTYHDALQKFPGDIVSKEGKPLLSWRVALLPYMEQEALFKEFKLDEPWDSEHNFKLLARMPEILRVGFEPKEATQTYYQRIALSSLPGVAAGPDGAGFGASGGEGSLSSPMGIPGAAPGNFGGGPATAGGAGFPGGAAPAKAKESFQFPLHMIQVTDGLSNTVGILEAGPGVPWTKPADFLFDTTKALPAMSWPFGNVHHVAMLDGVAVGLKPNLESRFLQQLVHPSDGSVLPDFNTLKARIPADSEEEKKALAQLQKENLTLLVEIQKEMATLVEYQSINDAEDVKLELKRILDALRVRNDDLRVLRGLPRQYPVPVEMKDATSTTVAPK